MATAPRTSFDRPPLLDCLDDAVLVVDERLFVLYANSAARSLAGSGAALPDLRALVTGGHPGGVEELVRLCVDTGRIRTTVRAATPAGARAVELTITNEIANPDVNGLVARLRLLDEPGSLSGDRVSDSRADPNERYDELTGFPTRRMVLDRLQAEIDRAESGSPIAVFFLDLDGFRHINDALGHTAGDAMLKTTASALLEAHPTLDDWGRIGGDEFLLLVPGIDEPALETIGPTLSEAARRTIALGGRTFVSTVSIGFTFARNDGRLSAHDLVHQADIAMHSGKRRSPGLLTRFDPELQREVLRTAELESQLRANLLGTGPGFALQPIMNARTHTTYAVEALVRFRSPTLGPVRADWVVEIAERAGLVHQLDRHVLRKAGESIEHLTDPVDGSPLTLSVNCSSTTEPQGVDLSARMLTTIEEARLPPQRLIVEVTESAAVHGDAVLRTELSRLRDAGVRIAIDDFGTGHSSLSQLEELEVDVVKIDRTFMRDVPESPRRLRYLESITALVQTLGPELVVEGIEHMEQISPLMRQNVSLLQGYLFAKPTSPNDLRTDLERAAAVLERWRVHSSTPFQPSLAWSADPEIEDDGSEPGR